MATCRMCTAVGSTSMMRQRQLCPPSSCKSRGQLKSNHPQLMIRTDCGAVKQQSPCTLDVLHQRNPFQQGPVGFQHVPEAVLVSHRCAHHLDACSAVGKSDPLHTGARLPAASAICWRTSQNRGRIPPAFHTLILPKCTRMFASRLMYFFWDHVQIIKEREQPLASIPTHRAGPVRTEEA